MVNCGKAQKKKNTTQLLIAEAKEQVEQRNQAEY